MVASTMCCCSRPGHQMTASMIASLHSSPSQIASSGIALSMSTCAPARLQSRAKLDTTHLCGRRRLDPALHNMQWNPFLSITALQARPFAFCMAQWTFGGTLSVPRRCCVAIRQCPLGRVWACPVRGAVQVPPVCLPAAAWILSLSSWSVTVCHKFAAAIWCCHALIRPRSLCVGCLLVVLLLRVCRRRCAFNLRQQGGSDIAGAARGGRPASGAQQVPAGST